MRTLLALESFGAATTMVTLSLEEEAVVIAEAVADEAAITAELAEVARATDITESLEDLAVIADNIETATPIEGALFDTAANMAVAGTDVEPTVLVPASESYKGGKLAVESIKQRASDIWKSIKEAIKRIWARIESFFYKYFGTLPGMKRNIAAARKRVEAAGGMQIDQKKFTLSSGLRTLTIDGKVLKTESEVISGLKVMKEINDAVFQNSSSAKKFGEAIYEALTNFDPAKPAVQTNTLTNYIVDETAKEAKTSIFGSGSNFSGRYSGFEVKATKPFFNNTTIVIKTPESLAKDASISSFALLGMVARTGTFNVASTSKIPTVPDSVEFATLSLSSMDDILDLCDNLVSTLEAYQRGKNLKDALSFKDKLNAASEKATAAIARLEASDDANDRAATSNYRALVNMNTFYCNALANPATGLATNTQTVVNTMLSLVSKSLAHYR